MPKKDKKTLWARIFPGWSADIDDQAAAALPAVVFDDFTPAALAEAARSEGSDEKVSLDKLPPDRLNKYGLLHIMAGDPTIDSALKMHIAQALSSDQETGEIISIESAGDKDDKFTQELRNTFKEIVNKNCQAWAYNTAIYGAWFPRIYGGPGKGVELIRSDYYSHPRSLRMYERAGQLVGFTSTHQMQQMGRIVLMEPWKFMVMRIPFWGVPITVEPYRFDGKPFDIANDNYREEGLIESQNYGQSLLETAYGPWYDLQEAILSLNCTRRNAARIERLIGVNTGKLQPQIASKYMNEISLILKKRNQERATQSLRKGYVQTVINTLIPIMGDVRGRLDISAIEGNPNIDGLEDVNFHVKRLGSAIGIDPALLGFGELLSGGLGDGGFFRVSILAAIKAHLLRRAVLSSLESLFDIHIAWKFGKVFLPGEKPWRIVFNSVSTAMEREDMENKEGRINLATMMATLAQTVDPEMRDMDPLAFKNHLWTDILQVDEEKFMKMFPGKKEPPPGEGGEDAAGGDDFFESAIQKIVSDYQKGRI